MAVVNQVFNLADDIVRYAKACGKKSILQTKSIKPTKLEGFRFAPEAIGDTVKIQSKKFPTAKNIKNNKMQCYITVSKAF